MYELYPSWNITFSSFILQKVLAAHGAAKVSAYVTHGVFPKRSWERFTHKDGKYWVCSYPYPYHLNLY
jgi:phosphoribosylpyrophosphate synthetase